MKKFKMKNTLQFCALILVLSVAPMYAFADAPAAEAPAYTLAPGDQLAISVLGHDELKTTVTVLPDGSFDFPIAGHVMAAGQTVGQLTAMLTNGIGSQINQPQVTVSVVQAQEQKVNVLGAVRTPGLVDYKAGWHLLDALAAAGGPAQDPVQTRISYVKVGTTEPVQINAVGLLSGSDSSQNLAVSPGDVVFVQLRDPSEAQVQVIGQVVKPGVYPVPADGSTAMSLVAQAGGITSTGSLSQVQIMHQGNISSVDISTLASSQSPANSILLLPGDVLMVPTSTETIQVLGEVQKPGPYYIPSGNTAPITSVISNSGGLTSDADLKAVVVQHPVPNGQPTYTTYDLGQMLSGSIPSVTLTAGDVVYVRTRHKGKNGLTTFDELGPLAWFFRL